METALTILAYSISMFVPIIALVLMQKHAEMTAKSVFTRLEYALWIENIPLPDSN